jgi:hypothetical protein
MGTKRCKGGGELRLVPGTGTRQINQTRRNFGFLSHNFDQKRRERGCPSCSVESGTGTGDIKMPAYQEVCKLKQVHGRFSRCLSRRNRWNFSLTFSLLCGWQFFARDTAESYLEPGAG